ncbi:single-stranded DNA-binding protein [Campylobacter sp. RM9344]|uniref:Single-stranded DNA-binding protein n=1 Tax=Campylobacter californiensis TaxID=1032243 RepID=A0AAW3ZXW2_9BACT|nr:MULTISPECIES: single-stranded DNA-binding protein [unclassified Campylobacter]MBE2984804.1 single-stranded DNA-binding protein [Campylobacter sp. RM6883]MBE2986508.1 single-stranded DNA-binding protein [Campylobacter sp. RM12919]MBE2987708.1 single-stranded DNA-binding protein [Campylobacter sp. RM12920]MBE2994730.1 single-stranded DNA-binding protein [Campylobacter sp. RM6913]MBE3022356.1 single-stranded DNA-binding protein [Campylobacter sp. 7477a]MBE3029596.1 single-stranded DNA-binding
MFNKVVLVGNLTRDIELRYTTSGSAIGNSGIAVTRRFTANGEKREETCFIDISFFGKSAEIANQYLSKGSKILVEGRLKFDQWTDNNGQNRSKHSISVENMEMLGGGPSSQGGFNQNNQGGYQQGGYNSGSNFNSQNSGYNQNAPQRAQNQQFNKRSNEDYYEEKIPEVNVDSDNVKYESDDTIPF